jgi:hypothetical protein
VLTGRGADIIMIDDPLKPEEALSKVQRQACNEWFVHTLYSRLNDKRLARLWPRHRAMLASTCFGASDERRAFRGNPGQAGGVAKTG